MITLLTFVFVMVVTAILFGSWVVVSVCRFIWRGLVGDQRSMMPSIGGRPCMNSGCRSANPMHARFCRRCGSNLTEPVFGHRTNHPQPRFNPGNGHARQTAGNFWGQ